jgi:hypothetical protein
MQFLIKVDEARDRWRTAAETRIEAATRPGRRTIETIRTDARGRVIEKSVRTENVEPDMATLRWRMQVHPATRDDYRPPRQEITGEAGGPITVDVEHKAESLIDAIRKLKAQASEVEPDDE